MTTKESQGQTRRDLMIIALITDAVLITLIALIAGNYYRFWHRYCQETEPFTRHFSRIAEAHPLFWWGRK